ncbi:MAG: hypothetical protein R2849_14280 [Thermomicrobiales bacterium]
MLASGRINGCLVQCLSPKLQPAAQSGYAPDEQDHQNIENIGKHFGLDLPVGYRSSPTRARTT